MKSPKADADFVRCRRRQFPRGGRLQSALIPVGVAVLVWLAFLAPDVEENRSRFVFFSTLYCFWIGLFNSCQTINGALESGEWQYWVLGFRRPLFKYLASNFLASLLISFVQCVVFLASLFLLSETAGRAIFPDDGDSFAMAVCSGASNEMKHFLVDSAWCPALNAGIFLLVSFGFAALCGASAGTALSAFVEKSSASLKYAVACVVLVMISSSLVLEKDAPKNEYEFISEILCGNAEAIPAEKEFGKKALCAVSFAFPQRYFCNVALCPRSESVDNAIPKRRGNDEIAFRPWLILVRRVGGECLVMLLWCAAVLGASFIFIKNSNRYYELR